MVRPFRFAVLSGIYSWSKTELRELAARVQDLGYDVFQMSDHVAGPGEAMGVTGHPPSGMAVVPALMALADATDHLRVGSLVSCVGYHHPVVLASEMASVDLLSDGRLELGLGAGWLGNEYQALGIPFDPAPQRIDRLAEAVTLMKLLFSGDQVSFHGEYFQVEGFEGAPRPVQRPHPPIVIGGGARRVLQLAGREADVVSINYDNRSGLLGADGFRRSTEEATLRKIQWIREGAGDRFDEVEIHIGAYFTAVTDDPASVADQMSATFGLPVSAIMSHPHVLIGPVENICEQLVRRRELYGISYVSIGTDLAEVFAPVVERLAGK
jgi:probable F420-dependent oxidoreductase